jgi:hypothetical protein
MPGGPRVDLFLGGRNQRVRGVGLTIRIGSHPHSETVGDTKAASPRV